MKPYVTELFLFTTGSLLCYFHCAHLDSDISNKLKDNWTKFVQSLLIPNSSCYKTIENYGTIEVTKLNDEKCDIKIVTKDKSVCVKVNKKAPICQMSSTDKEWTITLTDPVSFCSDALSSLHMLLHSTSTQPLHGVALSTSKTEPRHMFVDPMVRMKATFQDKIDLHYSQPTRRLEPRDWPHRAVGGLMVLDRYWQPRYSGHRLLASAADPRYQAETMLQWMTSPRLTENALSPADSVLLTQTSCATGPCSGRGDAATCQGFVDGDCRCHPAVQPPVGCMEPSESSPYCDPASGSRRSCPYSAVAGADLEIRAHPGCKTLTAVVNGLASAHADIRRLLEAEKYPWQHFVVTILACPGTGGRLSDVIVGFPASYRAQLRSAGLPVDRDVLCHALRVYITNAEAQVLGGDSRLTHETFCLDDLVLSPVVHLARPRRPPPAAAPGARDAVHLWLGPAPGGVSVDFSQLVVKLLSVPAGLKTATPYSSLQELNGEQLPAGKCVVEIVGKNETRTTPSDNATTTTTMNPLNFSDTTAMHEMMASSSTGSIFGIAMLLLLLAYCMCQRTAGGGDWESDSSWSQSPASWTTSSTSSWSSTPSSSADDYSTESFDFERDAHLAGGRSTLEYMRRVQEEALRRRRLQKSLPSMVEPD